MVNWKFVQTQYKNIWVLVLVFGLILGFIAICGVFFKAFANVRSDEGIISSSGAWFILKYFFFGAPVFVLFSIYGLLSSAILVHRDLNRGYVASWMTSSMSRTTIFNSKLFTFGSSILLINLWMIFLELFVYGIKMLDFKAVIGPLLIGNLSLMMFSLLVGSIAWIIFSAIQKNGIAIGITLGIFGWFLLCYLLKDFKDLSDFKYVTIFSFVNSPLHFYDGVSGGESWAGLIGPAPIVPLAAKDFAWQIPVMFVVATGLLTGGQLIIKNKDFAF